MLGRMGAWRDVDAAASLLAGPRGRDRIGGRARPRRVPARRRLASALLEDEQRSATDVLRGVRWRVEAGERVGLAELMQATRAATAVFDPSLALDYARQAHAMAGSATTALAMAGPLMSLARFAEVEAALAPYEGQESGEDEAAMTLHFRVVALQIGLRRTPDALALLDRYADAYGSDSWRRRVRDERIGVTTHAGHHLEAAGLLHEMLADRGTSQEEFRRAWSGPIALVYSGDSETARPFADRVLVTREAPAADVTEVMAWTAARADAGIDWNRIEAALCPMLDGAYETGNVVLAEVCGFWLGSVALARGRVVTAQNRLAAGVSLLQAQDPFALHVLTLAMLAQARAMQRDLAGARGTNGRGRGNPGASPPHLGRGGRPRSRWGAHLVGGGPPGSRPDGGARGGIPSGSSDRPPSDLAPRGATSRRSGLAGGPRPAGRGIALRSSAHCGVCQPRGGISSPRREAGGGGGRLCPDRGAAARGRGQRRSRRGARGRR